MNPNQQHQAGFVEAEPNKQTNELRRIANCWLASLFLVLLIAYWPFDSFAQDKSEDTVRLTHDGNRTVYRLGYFDFDKVRNLEQLLDQIPDLQLELDDSMRGSEYVVLINNQIAGTAPRDLRDIGRQFSLADIKRIVIYRGPIALERAGISGPALNIVLKANADLSMARWEVNMPLVNTRYKVPNVRLSYSDRSGDMGYRVFADYLPNAAYRPRTRKEVYLDPDDLQPTEKRLTEYDENNGYYMLGGSLNWQLSDRLDLRLNSRLSERRKDRLQERWIDDQEEPGLTGLEDDRRMIDVGVAGVFQLTASSVWETQFDLIEERRDKLVTKGTEGEQGPVAASATRHEDQRLEFISSINTVTENGSEAGVSVYARSRERDALSALSFNPVQMKTDAEISEVRMGLIVNYNWQPQPVFKLFASLDVENWHLQQQNGPFSRDDQEVFLKPGFNIRWKFAPKSLLRISARREMRRLNFDQLVFNFDLDDEIIDTGNLSMVLEKSWLSTAFVERRVFNQKGRFGLGVFYRIIEDHIDRVPKLVGSGPGNIGDAYARGIQLTGRYEALGSPDVSAVIKADFTLQESEVTDPFTGQDRRLRGLPDKIFKLELRQEFVRASLDYVFDMVWTSNRYYSDYNYRETRSFSRPVANLKVNYWASDNFQVWLEVRGLFDRDESRSRVKYSGDPVLGQVSRYERSMYLEDRQFVLGLQGYF